MVLVTASLLIAFPPRVVDTGTTGPQAAGYRLRADREPCVPTPAVPPAMARMIGYPSGFTATYNPLNEIVMA